MAGSVIDKELRIVMVGKTGVGKSSLGNSLLGRHHFISSIAGKSVTAKCKVGHSNHIDGTPLCIVDTPGLFDNTKSSEQNMTEIVRCVGMSSPGPHAFLFVVNINNRFTQEEQETVNQLLGLFGEQVINHVVIVFTGKESLNFQKLTLAKYLEDAHEELSNLVQRCRSRCVTINNRAEDPERQADVNGIIDMVRRTISQNGETYYTGAMYEAAEKALKERMKLIDEEKHKKERELQKKQEKLEQQERELKESAVKLTQEHENEKRKLASDLLALQMSNTRQDARNEIQSSSGGVLKTLLKAVGNVIGGVLSGLANAGLQRAFNRK
ncbi:GTPase IMAP family member 9 [Patella vulgata]|uniref:GTPase IMAP family member 9 n=1 Tax=Patella vulgata TaxID=6465 RepID=UPI00217F7AE2|nr:GTPase IMAP family member 9 [Patella vulgata]